MGSRRKVIQTVDTYIMKSLSNLLIGLFVIKTIASHDCDLCDDAVQSPLNYQNHWKFDKDELCYAPHTTTDTNYWVCKGTAIRVEMQCPFKEQGNIVDRLKFDWFLKTCIWADQVDVGNQLCIHYETGNAIGDDTAHDVGVRIYLSNDWVWDVNLPSATLTLGTETFVCANYANSGAHYAPTVDHVTKVLLYKTDATQTWEATKFYVAMKNVEYHYRLVGLTSAEKLKLGSSADTCDKMTTGAGVNADMCEVTSW